MGFSIITPPDGFITATARAQCKLHLRIAEATITFDDEIDRLLETVVAWLAGPNGWLERSLGTQTLQVTADAFPDSCEGILLRRPPIISVSSVKYLDANGAEQTLAASIYYAIVGSDGLTRLWLSPNQAWPTTQSIRDAVRVEYEAGYADEIDDIDPALRQAIFMAVARLYENRGDGLGEGASNGFDPYIAGLFAPFRVYV